MKAEGRSIALGDVCSKSSGKVKFNVTRDGCIITGFERDKERLREIGREHTKYTKIGLRRHRDSWLG